MARSKHTRPLSILAKERMRAPRAARGAGDLADIRRELRGLKELGLPPTDPVRDDRGPWALPRIVARRPRPGFLHPLSTREVADALRFFGEPCCYGLVSVALCQRPRVGPELVLGRLLVPGRIRLFEQPEPPWRLPLPAAHPELARMALAGAVVEALGAAAVEVRWPGETLRSFMLFEVLMHEVGHHLLQHHKGKRTVRVARTADHEAWAARFAARCRAEWEEHSQR